MAGYSARINTYTTGDTIEAADTNEEFDALVTAFGTSGHVHDGTAGNGGKIAKLLGTALTIGDGTAGTDIAVTFDGESNDGVLTWMEDEDRFQYSDDVMIVDNETLIFGTDSDWTIKYDESGDDDLVLTGSDVAIESSTSAKPVLTITNTNADANGATLKFNKNGASPATSDVIGNIDFLSEDAGNAATTYGRIQGTIVDVTAGGEQGGIDFYVAELDGTLTKGMALAGAASDGDITVDISTHDGSTGGLKLGGTLVTSTASELNILDGKSFVDEDDMSSNSATGIASQQSIKAYVDATSSMGAGCVMEAGDGTEVTITESKEMKFVEGGGIDINWTDTDNGTDADPYDLTFAIDSTVTTLTGSQTLTNKTLTSPVLNTGVSGTAVKDEDNMSSDSATHLATQQSIKAYVDTKASTGDATALAIALG